MVTDMQHKLEENQQLKALAARIGSFLDDHVARLEPILTRCDALLGREKDLQLRVADFERQRQAWESEKQREIERLQDESESLMRAWQDLETEQRHLMVQGSGQRSQTGGRHEGGYADGASSHAALPASSEAGLPVQVTDSGLTRSQFQQLRREMQKHTQRKPQ